MHTHTHTQTPTHAHTMYVQQPGLPAAGFRPCRVRAWLSGTTVGVHMMPYALKLEKPGKSSSSCTRWSGKQAARLPGTQQVLLRGCCTTCQLLCMVMSTATPARVHVQHCWLQSHLEVTCCSVCSICLRPEAWVCHDGDGNACVLPASQPVPCTSRPECVQPLAMPHRINY